MSLKLEDVKGIVGKKAFFLRQAGIDSVEKLANSEVEDLLKIKGIGEATAKNFIDNAKELLKKQPQSAISKETETTEAFDKEAIEKEIEEEVKKLEEKRKLLQGNKVEQGEFVLVRITAKTQKGRVFQVSSVKDAKKAGIYDEKKEHLYTPEFVIVGKPGFLNEGLTEEIEKMNYFEEKSITVQPDKAFGKRDPAKIERIGIGKFRSMNEGKNPELGQDFVKKDGQRGTVSNIMQGRVIIDYNHPLAGHTLNYEVEIIDKIEDFNEKIEYFMMNKGIPQASVAEFNATYDEKTKTIEFTVPKMFLFQNLTMFKFGLAMDLQRHMENEVDDVKFVEIYEKMPVPQPPSESVMEKVEEFNKEQKEESAEETTDQAE